MKDLDKLTPKKIAKELKVSYSFVLELLKNNYIKSTKEKNRYSIDKADLQSFKDSNQYCIKLLEQEFLDLWLKGMSLTDLKNKTKEYFKQRNIILCPDADGFAESIIYKYAMAEKY